MQRHSSKAEDPGGGASVNELFFTAEPALIHRFS